MDKSGLENKWQERLKEFETSGNKNFKAWCENKGYSIHQAKYWRKKLQNGSKIDNQSTKWLSFEINGTAKPDIITRPESLLIKVGSASIEVQSGFSSKLLQDVVKSLSSIC